MLIYKIVPRDLWRAAEAAGVFAGAPVDLADGYMHFSTSTQLRETARRHFAGQHDLMLISVDAERLGAALRWEPSRGGDLFPHLYAPLATGDVVRATALPLAADGTHHFPNELP